MDRREDIPSYLRDLEGIVPHAARRSSTNGDNKENLHKTLSHGRRGEDQTIIRKRVSLSVPSLNTVERTNDQIMMIRAGVSVPFPQMLYALPPLLLIGALLVAKCIRQDNSIDTGEGKKRQKQTIRRSIERYLSNESVVYISRSWRQLCIVSKKSVTTECKSDANKERVVRRKKAKNRRKKKKEKLRKNASKVGVQCPAGRVPSNIYEIDTASRSSEDEDYFLTPKNSCDQSDDDTNAENDAHFPLHYATPMKSFEDWKATSVVVRPSPFLTPPRRNLFKDDAVCPHSKSPFGTLSKTGFSEQIQSVKSCMTNAGMNEEEAARKACDLVSDNIRHSKYAEIEFQNRRFEYEIQMVKQQTENSREYNRRLSGGTNDESPSGENRQGVGKMLGSALSFLGSNFKFSVALARILRFLAWYSATKSISQVRLELHNITDILPFLIDQACGCTNYQSETFSFTNSSPYIYYFLPSFIELMWMSSIPRFMCLCHWVSHLCCICLVHFLLGKFYQIMHLGFNKQLLHDALNIAWMLCIDDTLSGIVKPLAMYNVFMATFISSIAAIAWIQGKRWRQVQYLGMSMESYVNVLVKGTAILSYGIAVFVGYYNPII